MKMFINGQWVESADAKTIVVINPADETIIDEVPDATVADVNQAVASSKQAFKRWRKTTAAERSHLLKLASRKLEQHADKYHRLLTSEQGKQINEHVEELEVCIETIDYYAQLIKNGIGRVLPANNQSCLNLVVKEPYGPTACIIPFNYPLLLLFWKIAPALAAGNTVIVKPSEKTPLATLSLMEDVLDHFPPGVINVITGGPVAGERLSTHPDVPTVAFTGSTVVGEQIIRSTAGMVKNLHLELGGKDAVVVTEDVNIPVVARALATSAMWNTGQICTSTERIYVQQSIYEAFLKEFAEVVAGLRVGPGLDDNVQVGPLCDASGFDKVERHIADAKAGGARVLTGGERCAEFKAGYYFQPTVLADVNHDMLCMTEETFGPSVGVMPYNSFDEAIELVNGTVYGLGAVLMSNDHKKVKQFFEDVKAGTIWINDPLPDHVGGPFGGMKTSGTHARELGPEGLESFMETKHIHWEFEPETITDNWFEKNT